MSRDERATVAPERSEREYPKEEAPVERQATWNDIPVTVAAAAPQEGTGGRTYHRVITNDGREGWAPADELTAQQPDWVDPAVRAAMETANPPEQGAPATAAGPQGGIPFMMTRQMKADLAARGFTPEQIRGMTPQQAHEVLRAQASEPPRPAPPPKLPPGVKIDSTRELPWLGGTSQDGRTVYRDRRIRDLGGGRIIDVDGPLAAHEIHERKHRRHLPLVQLVMIGAELATLAACRRPQERLGQINMIFLTRAPHLGSSRRTAH
jgi:hypothetical protein